jgi:hypothetical protein
MANHSTNPALEQLNSLIGAWRRREHWDGTGCLPLARRSDGPRRGPILVQQTDLDRDAIDTASLPDDLKSESPMPVTAMIGLDDSCEEFSMLHADARGVLRVYQMTLKEAVWKSWRSAPTLHQRFVGQLNDDATKITAVWEKSRDGFKWEHDLDVIYTKLDRTRRL